MAQVAVRVGVTVPSVGGQQSDVGVDRAIGVAVRDGVRVVANAADAPSMHTAIKLSPERPIPFTTGSSARILSRPQR